MKVTLIWKVLQSDDQWRASYSCRNEGSDTLNGPYCSPNIFDSEQDAFADMIEQRAFKLKELETAYREHGLEVEHEIVGLQ